MLKHWFSIFYLLDREVYPLSERHQQPREDAARRLTIEKLLEVVRGYQGSELRANLETAYKNKGGAGSPQPGRRTSDLDWDDSCDPWEQ